MIIVLASNFFNHHEKFLCDEISKQPGVEFIFIQTQPMREERKKMGWGLDTSKLPYVYNAYETKSNLDWALQVCNKADAVILGNAPYDFIAERVSKNKLTFFYAERLFRKGMWHMMYPPTFFTVLKRFIIPGNKSNFYMLCASGYTAFDSHRIFAFRNRCFKWGHFIEVKHFESVNSLLEAKKRKHPNCVSILWAGRLLELKHPEQAIQVAERLKQQGYCFEMNIIGTGEMEEGLKRVVRERSLTDNVHFLGTMKPQEVRSYMEDADIYLFTSDFNEGWGAVLGEAMASGCAVVTSHGIGATPFLTSHNKNALVYETGNEEALFCNVKKLMDSEELRIKLSRNAISTMEKDWNATVGAERFYLVARSLIEKKPIPEYMEGPMSKAPLLNNKWFKNDTV